MIKCLNCGKGLTNLDYFCSTQCAGNALENVGDKIVERVERKHRMPIENKIINFWN